MTLTYAQLVEIKKAELKEDKKRKAVEKKDGVQEKEKKAYNVN